MSALFFVFGQAVATPLQADSPQLLTDFSTAGGYAWGSITDTVMGGRSSGKVAIKQGKLKFSGEVSLENNGGFASMRSQNDPLDLSAYQGIELRIKGDGRSYYLTCRDSTKSRRAFWAPVQTKPGSWMTIRIPFDEFYATYFGRKVPSRKLKLDHVCSIGLMLYDKQAGAFSVELDSIKVY
ncbi:CIA30 family protein [Persicirhabdus sediminis]|uniref:CIA30 family protein n=1 Tax=Persicirhabdus sediminis TaxID=454144 RepID=A0A8J7MDL0_9BACT|nr:CIA30 family protein [Persicirhabdus sediminis]MBK1791067.1 CIA30 family protein [Persicirhabdus sediminis]